MIAPSYENVIPRNWNVVNVCMWADDCKYPSSVVKTLANNGVDGQQLLLLSKDDLREELKIASLMIRKRLWLDIQVIKGFDRIRDGSKDHGQYLKVKRSFESIGGDEANTLESTLQQREILHISCANLQHIRNFGNFLNIGSIHYFCNNP